MVEIVRNEKICPVCLSINLNFVTSFGDEQEGEEEENSDEEEEDYDEEEMLSLQDEPEKKKLINNVRTLLTFSLDLI